MERLFRLLLGRRGKRLVRGAPEEQHLQDQRAVEKTTDTEAKKLHDVTRFLQKTAAFVVEKEAVGCRGRLDAEGAAARSTCSVVKRRASPPPKFSKSVTNASCPVVIVSSAFGSGDAVNSGYRVVGTHLWDARDDADRDPRRRESPLVFGWRQQHPRRERRKHHHQTEARRVRDLWRVERPQQQHEDHILHEDDQVFPPRAHRVPAQQVVHRARHVKQHFHVERRGRESRHVLGAQDLEDLRQFQDQTARDDRVPERLADHELDAVDVGKVVVREKRIKARGREHAKHELRRRVGRGRTSHGREPCERQQRSAERHRQRLCHHHHL